ncbi:biotin synthase [Bradyrhizobium sp. USDA 4463]
MDDAAELQRKETGIDAQVRCHWRVEETKALYDLPFADLMLQAQCAHRKNFDPNHVETASLLSIKTGGCPEDCGYCSQSAHYETGLKATRLMRCADVVATAQCAKDAGATRFCMAAAWRTPKDSDVDSVCDMVKAVKELGMETCVTLGMLTPKQAARLAEAGLDFYNHNVDTSPEFYSKIITTRSLQDRIDTLARVRDAGIKICSGGIIGMGERVEDRLGMLVLLANLPNPSRKRANQPVEQDRGRAGGRHRGASRSDSVGSAGGDRADHDAEECGSLIRWAAIYDR